MKLPWLTRKGAIRLACLFALLAILSLGGWISWMCMPGTSFEGPLPKLSSRETELSATMRRDVEELAGRIGIRNAYSYSSLLEAADYVERRFRESGLTPTRHTFDIEGRPFHNIEAEIPGSSRRDEIVILGAHYDSIVGSPGANDNASGVAALLSLATAFHAQAPARTLRFVAFVNEEPPPFQTENMGSLRYAKRCRQRNEKITAMISLETMGCYSDLDGSQSYPPPLNHFYPSKGNFIAIVGNFGSRSLVRQAVGSFRRHAQFPSEGGSFPGWLTGVGWSDHWSFWQEGYPGIMFTDTAPFRYAQYHDPKDTPEKVDTDRLARVFTGIEKVVDELINP